MRLRELEDSHPCCHPSVTHPPPSHPLPVTPQSSLVCHPPPGSCLRRGRPGTNLELPTVQKSYLGSAFLREPCAPAARQRADVPTPATDPSDPRLTSPVPLGGGQSADARWLAIGAKAPACVLLGVAPGDSRVSRAVFNLPQTARTVDLYAPKCLDSIECITKGHSETSCAVDENHVAPGTQSSVCSFSLCFRC